MSRPDYADIWSRLDPDRQAQIAARWATIRETAEQTVTNHHAVNHNLDRFEFIEAVRDAFLKKELCP